MNISQFVDGIEKAAADNIKAEQGDYIVDGLLHCGKCHTKKQTRVFILDRERTPMCLCQCQAEKRQKEEDDRKRAEFEKRVKELRRAGFPESDMEDWTFANDDKANKKITKVARNYLENFDRMREDGKGLLFFGTVGTGKTFYAACIANGLIDRGIPVLMTNFAHVQEGIWKGKLDYDSLNRFPLLILDDLATERKTDYMQEIVYNVIDSRYRAGLPLIVTTNLTADQLKNPAEVTNQRTFSRLLEMCFPLEVAGADRRREKLRSDFDKYRDILGI